jgi:hypothetical protein
MSGSSPLSDLDLERGVPTTAADVLALRRVRRSRRLSTEQYLRALSRVPPLPPGTIERRRRAGGVEPFRLGRHTL